MKIIALLLLCVSSLTTAKEAVPVIAYQVHQTVNDLSFIAIGYAKAYQSINIQMPTEGVIKKILFKPGDNVKKGDIIVSQYSELLKVQKKRDQLLINKHASKSEQKNRKNYAFQSAILQLATTKLQIKQKQFKAPFDGVLGQLRVSEGALITASKIISTLDSVKKIRVGFDVSETKLKLIKKGTTIKILAKQTKQLINTGKVSFIASHVNKKNRSIAVEGIVNNTKGSIKPGMFLDVEVVVKNKKVNIYIPNSAVKKHNASNVVYIIKGNTITKTSVVLGKANAKQVQILKGLKGNELIVARGLSQLEGVTKIKVIDQLN